MSVHYVVTEKHRNVIYFKLCKKKLCLEAILVSLSLSSPLCMCACACVHMCECTRMRVYEMTHCKGQITLKK